MSKAKAWRLEPHLMPLEAFLTLGGRLAGTQFHSHGPAFLLLAAGQKRR